MNVQMTAHIGKQNGHLLAKGLTAFIIVCTGCGLGGHE